MYKRIIWSLAVAAIFTGGSAMAAGQNMGSGMMGGYGPGMMYAAATTTRAQPNATARPGYYRMSPYRMGGNGMGPRMMGRYGANGMGPGMMGGYGGYGMGPGMMGGYGAYGMGPGMMGGYGMGPGMMGGYGGYLPGLSSEQRGKIASIWNNSVSKAWPIMGELREQSFQFAQLMAKENPDRAAINKAYSRISDLRKQLLDLRLDARQQMLGVLTADQRRELQKGFYHHWQ